MQVLAGYVPFVDPINVFHDWWYFLLVPLSFQIVLAMVALAIALVVLVQLVIPWLPVE
jgi:hypothetical protein